VQSGPRYRRRSHRMTPEIGCRLAVAPARDSPWREQELVSGGRLSCHSQITCVVARASAPRPLVVRADGRGAVKIECARGDFRPFASGQRVEHSCPAARNVESTTSTGGRSLQEGPRATRSDASPFPRVGSSLREHAGHVESRARHGPRVPAPPSPSRVQGAARPLEAHPATRARRASRSLMVRRKKGAGLPGTAPDCLKSLLLLLRLVRLQLRQDFLHCPRPCRRQLRRARTRVPAAAYCASRFSDVTFSVRLKMLDPPRSPPGPRAR